MATPSDDAAMLSDAESVAIPWSLRTWFRVAGGLDVLSGIPLLFSPGHTLGLLGWSAVDSTTTRLIGAALLGLGLAASRVHRYGFAGYRLLLHLQMVWSLAAAFASLAAVGDGAPQAAWAFLSIFIVFAGVWTSYAIRLRQIERAGLLKPNADSDEETASDGDAPADTDTDTDGKA